MICKVQAESAKESHPFTVNYHFHNIKGDQGDHTKISNKYYPETRMNRIYISDFLSCFVCCGVHLGLQRLSKKYQHALTVHKVKNATDEHFVVSQPINAYIILV